MLMKLQVNVGNDNNQAAVLWTSPDGKSNDGYHVRQKDVFTIAAELINYRAEAINIYIDSEIEYLPTIEGRNVQETEISVTGCTFAYPWTSPTEAVNTTSNNFIFFQNGDILDASR
jgi:hypothetical protein